MSCGGKRIAWTAAAVAITVVGSTLAVSYPAFVEWWQGIRVVRTWGDLLAQPAIDLGDGVTVRLGIEGKRGPRWSGVLVYCLAEGCRARPWAGEGGPIPLSFSLRGAGAAGPPVLDEGLSLCPSREPGPPRLFTRTVPLPVIGKLQLRVLSPRGSRLYCSTLEGTGEAFHPWMPIEWGGRTRGLKLRVADLSIGTFIGDATNRADGIALPVLASDASFPSSETAAGLEHPDRLLPSLLPRPGEPEIEMRLTEHLVLTPPRALPSHLAEMRILARWWVNGQPFLPLPGKVRQSFEHTGPVGKPSSRLRLGLEIESERLGAKSGDTIGLQLLYTSRGWVEVSPSLFEKKPEKPWLYPGDDDPPPILTNRIEFPAP